MFEKFILLEYSILEISLHDVTNKKRKEHDSSYSKKIWSSLMKDI